MPAGALWSLAADATNQRLISEAAGIAPLVELLKAGKMGAKNAAQETAAGALHSLALRFDNRTAIAEAGGIELLIPLFEGAKPSDCFLIASDCFVLLPDCSRLLRVASDCFGLLRVASDCSWSCS